MVWAYLTGKRAQELVPKWTHVKGRRWQKSLRKQVILYGLTSESRMRSQHPALPVALGLNPSLTVDSLRSRLCGSAGIGNA